MAQSYFPCSPQTDSMLCEMQDDPHLLLWQRESIFENIPGAVTAASQDGGKSVSSPLPSPLTFFCPPSQSDAAWVSPSQHTPAGRRGYVSVRPSASP